MKTIHLSREERDQLTSFTRASNKMLSAEEPMRRKYFMRLYRSQVRRRNRLFAIIMQKHTSKKMWWEKRMQQSLGLRAQLNISIDFIRQRMKEL